MKIDKNTEKKIETMIAGAECFGQLKEMLVGMLVILSPIEQQVLISRFGIDDGKPLSIEALSENLGCSPGHILQIEAEALEKLRNIA